MDQDQSITNVSESKTITNVNERRSFADYSRPTRSIPTMSRPTRSPRSRRSRSQSPRSTPESFKTKCKYIQHKIEKYIGTKFRSNVSNHADRCAIVIDQSTKYELIGKGLLEDNILNKI